MTDDAVQDDAPPDDAPPEAGTDETDDAPPSPPEPVILRCPACLSTVAPDQAYCLDCGERLPPGKRPARGVLGMDLTTRGVGIVAAAAVIALGGVAIAYGLTRDAGKQRAQTQRTTKRTGSTVDRTTISTPSVSTITPTDTFIIPTFSNTTPTEPFTYTFPTEPTTTEPTTTTRPTTTTTTTQPVSQPPGVSGDDWPDARNAYAVILSSKPSATWTWDEFLTKRATARSQGFSRAGLLDSSDYLSLVAGYYVLYEGPYASKAAAVADLAGARARYADAYVRFVSEDQP